MSGMTNRRISNDEPAGVCWVFHNMMVGGNWANKKATCDHMTDFDIRLPPHILF